MIHAGSWNPCVSPKDAVQQFQLTKLLSIFLQSKRTWQQPWAQSGVGWTSCEVRRVAADPVFCFDCCLKGGIYPATLHRLLQLAIRLFFIFTSFKRGRTINCLLWLPWITLACCILCVSVPHADQRGVVLSGRRHCCTCPSPCAHMLLPAAPLGEHIPGSSFTPSARAAFRAPLQTPLTCPQGDGQWRIYTAGRPPSKGKIFLDT